MNRPPRVQNGGVRLKGGTARRGAALLTASVLAALALSACSSGDDIPGGTTSPSASTTGPSPSSSPSVQVVDGVTLTAQGSTLTVGQAATVAYSPRQSQTGVLEIKVTRLEKTSFKDSFVGWDLDKGQRQSNPYFVRATVTNRGSLDLGGRPVPLYIVDGGNTLIEATPFASTFKPCNPGEFPKKFPTGAKVKVCMTYLAPQHGDLAAVSYRPTQADMPITWTGTLQAPKPPKTHHKGKGKHHQG